MILILGLLAAENNTGCYWTMRSYLGVVPEYIELRAPCNLTSIYSGTHFFYRQLDFSSEPGVANENLENEPKSCLTVA